jgi:hypothetical protein
MFQNDIFLPLPSDDSKLWRYMDFVQLVSILQFRTLFFARADKFEDTFEAAMTNENYLSRQLSIEDVNKYSLNHYYVDFSEYRKMVAINCWHQSDYESAAMWKLYNRSYDGVAIQTTLGDFKRCFRGKEPVFIGKVNYIDYEKDSFDFHYPINLYLNKRNHFEHEKEIRALVNRNIVSSSTYDNLDYNYLNDEFLGKSFDQGLSVEIDPAVLIRKVYISPHAPAWFGDIVNGFLLRHLSQYELIKSNLYDATPKF